MNPDMEGMLKQIRQSVELHPERNRENRCADCLVYPPFQPVQFVWNDQTLEWKLSCAKENYHGWVNWMVLGGREGPKRICGACAKKRGMV